MAERIFTRNFDRPSSHTLGVYRETGGYTALPKALQMEPAAITEEVKKSNLRGLGGAAVHQSVDLLLGEAAFAHANVLSRSSIELVI